jgi:hypothetical protein
MVEIPAGSSFNDRDNVAFFDHADIPEASFFSDMKSFAREHKILSVMTLGVAVVGYSIGRLVGRAVVWLGKLFGVCKKAELHYRETTVQPKEAVPEAWIIQTKKEIAAAPINQGPGFGKGIPTLAYQNVEMIRKWGGVILTKDYNSNPNDSSPDFVGLVAMRERNGYGLHLCTGGGYGEFSKQQIEEYIEEATLELIAKRIKIDRIEESVGRHAGKTIENFREWQQDQIRTLQSN